MDARESIRRRGGAAATWELYVDGFDRSSLAGLVRRGEIVRVRQGWFIEPSRPQELVAAARVGGRATCASALRLRGYWVVPDRRLHVAVRPDRCQLRRPDDRRRRLGGDQARVRVHWTDHVDPASRLMVGPLDALRDLAQCFPPEMVGASAESIVHVSNRLGPAIRGLASSLPGRFRAVLEFVDGCSESGTEFLFRWRMRDLSDLTRPQVEIAGVGRVDFVLGECLVVEVDGAAYHTDTDKFEEDRRRDAALSALGYRVLRFTYRQVMGDWPRVEAAVRAAIARGDQW